MRFVNGWNYLFKERDRFNIELRLGVVTVFQLYFDFSDREYFLTVLNGKVVLC